MCMKFSVRVLADRLLLIMNFFVSLEISIQIRLCKSWFIAVAATVIHTQLKGHFEKYFWIVAKQKKEFMSTVVFLLISSHIYYCVVLLWM